MSTRVVEGMAVEIAGSGDAVICIHGLGGTSNTFQPQMAALAGRRVVRPDLPGSGRSALLDRPTIPLFAAALARMAKALQIESAAVVAHSMGTIVAQHLAAHHETLVRRMVLLGALIEPLEAAREALRQRAAAARLGGIARIADQIVQGGISAEVRERNPVAAAFVRESILRQAPEGYARTCEALASARAADHREIRCPVLLITGEEDATAPPSMARMLADRIASARVRILPRCGHWATVERPDEVNAEIRRFL
jgi:pimeloyl-ACP methyl ester carboxylesterase